MPEPDCWADPSVSCVSPLGDRFCVLNRSIDPSPSSKLVERVADTRRPRSAPLSSTTCAKDCVYPSQAEPLNS